MWWFGSATPSVVPRDLLAYARSSSGTSTSASTARHAFSGSTTKGGRCSRSSKASRRFAPVPPGDDVVVQIGRLLRRAHDAQAGFVPPVDPGWNRHPADGLDGEVIGHCDLFWTNVIFRERLPVALIDWEIARPTTRSLEVALAATYWAPVRVDRQSAEWGLPLDRRGERLRLLCDGYGLTAGRRAVLLDELIAYRRARLEHHAWRGVTPREVIVENLRWVEDHYDELATFLA